MMIGKIGIDFGGTKIELIALNGENGKELYRKRIPTLRDDYARTLSDVIALIAEAEKTIEQICSIGIGITGLVNPKTGQIQNSNATWMNGKPFQDDLEFALKRPVRIENDANCFAMSEAVNGAGKGFPVIFGAILGTGCGGGLVVHHHIITGRNNIAGQWGHSPLPYPRLTEDESLLSYFANGLSQTFSGITYFAHDDKDREAPGAQCYCGKRGCLETWISGTGLKLDYQRVENESLSTHDIIAQMRAGNPKAQSAMTRYYDRLARAFSVVINLIDPDVIVLGGGMSNVAEIYTEVPRIWAQYCDCPNPETLLLPPRHGDSSGVRGAALLWMNAEHERALGMGL